MIFKGFRQNFSTFASSQALYKKFYKQAYVVTKSENEFQILLDKSSLKTPNKNTVIIPNFVLALSISHEFNCQQEYLKFANMPLFGMSRTAIDADHQELLRQYFQERIFQFFENDTICFREDLQNSRVKKLAESQYQLLDPMVDYIKQLLDIQLTINEGLFTSSLKQEDKSKFLQYIDKMNNWELTGLEMLSSVLKSTSLGLALLNDKITIEQAINLSRIEENFQIQLYGLVEGSHDIDQGYVSMMVSSAKLFTQLCKQ